jgi:hypothetical protein
MVVPPLPAPANLAVTVSDLKTLHQLVDSGQLKTWQVGAVLDVVVNRRDGGLLMLDTGKGLIGLPVPADTALKPGTALQLQVLALAPLQIQLRPTPEPSSQQKTALPASGSPLLTLPGTSQASPVLAPGMAGPQITGSPMTGSQATVTTEVDSNPVRQLSRQLAAALRPLLSQPSLDKPSALPARLNEWLARIAPTLAQLTSLLPADSPRPASADWPKLTQALLASWPSADQASEPEPLETLLRQALFGDPIGAGSSTSGTPSTRSGSDWLGSIVRLLLAMPTAAPTASTILAAANAATTTSQQLTNTSPSPTRTDDKTATQLTTPIPLAEELIDELASVLGRQQQHWLNNAQADARQLPLYAELLLRHGERLDPFELTVREDAKHRDNETNAEARHHVVRLRFDLPGLGVCQFLLDLNADDLQLHFYSERADTVSLFNAHLDTLAGMLAADAIHLSNVQSHRVELLPALQNLLEQGFHVRV